MAVIYNLWFRREWSDREDTEIYIGTYSSLNNAKDAVSGFESIQGFGEFMEGFAIEEAVLNETGWKCGIIFAKGPPPKDTDGKIDYLPAYVEEYLPGGAKFDGVHMSRLRKV